jgi:hypothetical protein
VTGKVSFREVDLRRAVKAVQAAGLPVTAIEITPDGTIRVLTSEPAPALSPYDQWEADQARRGT